MTAPQDTAAAGTALPAVLADPGERGTTILADKVVEKIAARAALDVPHAQGLERRIAGRSVGARSVRVRAEVDGRVATLRIELAVAYPASVRDTTRQVRAHVRDLVGRYCDLNVGRVDIAVTVLRRADPDRRS